ncbi:MAG: hypothetical protein ACI837_003530 [Crocinitomicaceae bacterium]|jgi:hypothetical protein
MESIQQVFANLPANDIDQYIEMGNNAIKQGDEQECIKWYTKGLSKARELCDPEKETYISSLIITLI